MNTQILNRIETGLLEFYNLDPNEKLVIRDKYQDHIAYLWSFPTKKIITTSQALHPQFAENDIDESLFVDQPDVACYVTPEMFKPSKKEDATYRVLTKEDAQLVESFHQACPAIDKEFGEVNIDDAFVIGTFSKDELVAIASIWVLPNDLADIGVLVKPSAKKQGFGAVTVSYLIQEIMDKYIPIYRADFENFGSVKIYQKLGFKPALTIRGLK